MISGFCKKHMQTTSKTPVKFQKDWAKTVGELCSQGTYFLCTFIVFELQKSPELKT